jgi:hypothetical protein
VRAGLWRALGPIDDCDFTTPIDAVLQGYSVVYAPEAVAYDDPPSSARAELRTRIRQTSKNLIGTLRRWGWQGWIKHPVVSWGLISHKILRWFTPFVMVFLILVNILLVGQNLVYLTALGAQILFYALAVVGIVSEAFETRIPIASVIASFCIANLGMGIGVIRGLTGKAPASYRSAEAATQM